MKFQVEILDYDQLTDEAKLGQPENGCGAEWANYLHVRHNNETFVLASDAMEPEDARFSRDLSWIVYALQQAYELGRQDALREAAGG